MQRSSTRPTGTMNAVSVCLRRIYQVCCLCALLICLYLILFYLINLMMVMMCDEVPTHTQIDPGRGREKRVQLWAECSVSFNALGRPHEGVTQYLINLNDSQYKQIHTEDTYGAVTHTKYYVEEYNSVSYCKHQPILDDVKVSGHARQLKGRGRPCWRRQKTQWRHRIAHAETSSGERRVPLDMLVTSLGVVGNDPRNC